jgi:phage repressor protein C with HTH and peptisase S24 domain
VIWLQVLRVRGVSLAPRYRDGDYVVISGLETALGLRRIRPGDVVVFDHPDYGRLIKRVVSLEPCGQLRVRGDDPDSVDSRRFGPLPHSAVLGRVIFHIRQAALALNL